jgi:chemotaxis family two-component system response regulator PixG
MNYYSCKSSLPMTSPPPHSQTTAQPTQSQPIKSQQTTAQQPASRQTSSRPITSPLIKISPLLTQVLSDLKQSQRTGILTGQSGHTRWRVYVYLGRILYAEGGIHPVRQWLGELHPYLVNLEERLAEIRVESLQLAFPGCERSRTYQLLLLFEMQGILTADQTKQVIHNLVAKVLFEMAETPELKFRFKEGDFLEPRLSLISMNEVTHDAYDRCQQWSQCQLPVTALHKVPWLYDLNALHALAPEDVAIKWQKLLQKPRTLQELAHLMNCSPVELAQRLTPLLRRGIVTLDPVADKVLRLVGEAQQQPDSQGLQAQAPLIACIDDSEVICERMREVVTAAGYRFEGIQDPRDVVNRLQSHPPALIFLDLVMPHSNGYDICARLRRIPILRQIPIVILSSHDGILERMRAKLVGSTYFLSKPVMPNQVLEAIHTLLPSHHPQSA